MAADVTVFDPATIAEQASFQDPHQYAVGVQHVLINGIPVIAYNEHTGTLTSEMQRRH